MIENLVEKTERLKAAIDIASGAIDDETADRAKELYPFWETDTYYEVGDRRRYGEGLYRCIQAHESQDNWTPDITPALWVSTSTEEYPEWVQPLGSEDAYHLGDKVSHLDKHWISNMDANVYEPSVYGWDEETVPEDSSDVEGGEEEPTVEEPTEGEDEPTGEGEEPQNEEETIPEWTQPTGAHDAYNIGDKVTHNGRTWVCTMDANTYEPSVFGWDEVVDEQE